MITADISIKKMNLRLYSPKLEVKIEEYEWSKSKKRVRPNEEITNDYDYKKAKYEQKYNNIKYQARYTMAVFKPINNYLLIYRIVFLMH